MANDITHISASKAMGGRQDSVLIQLAPSKNWVYYVKSVLTPDYREVFVEFAGFPWSLMRTRATTTRSRTPWLNDRVSPTSLRVRRHGRSPGR